MKGVLFDFDGVVVQSEQLHMTTFLELLEPYGVKVSEKRWYSEFAGTGSKHIFEVLVKEYKILKSVDELVQTRKDNYEKAVRNGMLKLTPGVVEFLKKLKEKKIKIAIVSGSHRTNINAALEIFCLAKFFDVIVSGDELEKRKPDPEPFLYAARKLDLTPDECMAIEDSVPGAKSVKAAGMKLVIVHSPANILIDEEAIEIKDFEGFNLP
ncbi:MAG: HAD family phosphatase [Candidatus Micrarchaeota archaeon]